MTAALTLEVEVLTPTLESFRYIPDEVFIGVNLCLDKSMTTNFHPCCHPWACQELPGSDNLHQLFVSSQPPSETDPQTITLSHRCEQTGTWAG